MEIAHSQTGTLRVLAKVVVLLLLLVLLAKIIAALLVLAIVGGCAYVGTRLIYSRRDWLRNTARRTTGLLLSTGSALVHVLLELLVLTSGTFLGFVLWLLGQGRRSAYALTIVVAATCVPLGRAIQCGSRASWNVLCGAQRFVRHVLCGALIEAGSGALVGGLLGYILLQQIQPLETRIAAPAVFGALLGLTVCLARLPWLRDEERPASDRR